MLTTSLLVECVLAHEVALRQMLKAALTHTGSADPLSSTLASFSFWFNGSQFHCFGLVYWHE